MPRPSVTVLNPAQSRAVIVRELSLSPSPSSNPEGAVSALPDHVVERLARQFYRLRHACGCATGAVAMWVGAALSLALVVDRLVAGGSVIGSVPLLVVVPLVSAFLGKALGIAVARIRLRWLRGQWRSQLAKGTRAHVNLW